MNEKRFYITDTGLGLDTESDEMYSFGDEEDFCRLFDKLNEQQSIIEELKTHNLQHFLEWLVIRRYVTDEPMKDINNVIDCVNKFKEYLTELDKFKEWLEVLEDE